MKILTGSMRGRDIVFKSNQALRPTSDKVRMALMNMLRPRLSGARVLDLFSGTGALGFESLSNGAQEVIFVEDHAPQAGQIQKTIHNLGLIASAKVVKRNVYVAIPEFKATQDTFDIIFTDAPYGMGHADKALQAIRAARIASPGAALCFEIGKDDVFEGIKDYPDFVKKSYGDTAIFILST